LNRKYNEEFPYDEGLAWMKVRRLVDAGSVSIENAAFAVKGELSKRRQKEGGALQKHAPNKRRRTKKEEDLDEDLPIGITIPGRGYRS
jgi:hypothetical protein